MVESKAVKKTVVEAEWRWSRMWYWQTAGDVRGVVVPW